MTSTADLVADLGEKPSEPKTFKTMTASERLTYVKQVITVEPIIAAYVMASIICQPALLNLEFEKACLSNLDLSDTICNAIIYEDSLEYTEINGKLQEVIGNMHSWQGLLQSIMPLILVLFLGSYSDRHQVRKPFLLVPILGEFFAVAGCILCVVFMREWPLQVQGVVQTVVPSFFGGQPMIVMAVFAYIADVSTLEMRTLRVGVVQIVLNVCTPIGQAVAGILFNKIGYYGVLCMAAGFYLFAVVYCIFGIKEPKKPKEGSTKSLVADIFDPNHAVQTFNVLFKKGEGNNRLLIVIVLFILFIYSLVATGEISVFYLYVQGTFNWHPDDFSYYLTVNTLIHLIGTLVGLPLFTNYFKMGDLAVLAATFIDKILTNIVFALAKSSIMLYVAAAVSIITGISTIAIRSLATKIVSPDDLGKAQSLFGICEALGPALAAPVYNTGIYLNTYQTFPSLYFYVGIILYGLCTLVVGCIYFKTRPTSVQPSEIPPIPPSDINGKSEDFQMTHM